MFIGKHMGANAVVENVTKCAIGAKMFLILESITQKNELWLKNNPKIQIKPPPGDVKKGITPGEYWQIDFYELLGAINIDTYLCVGTLIFLVGLRLSCVSKVPTDRNSPKIWSNWRDVIR